MSRYDWIYLAGLTDGEGSFHIVNHKKKKDSSSFMEPQITVTNCSVLFRDWARTHNMPVTFDRRSRRVEGWQDKYTLTIHGYGNVAKYIEGTLPFLVIKKPVALLLREFVRRRHELPFHSMNGSVSNDATLLALYGQIRLLNSKQRQRLYPLEKRIVMKYSSTSRRRRRVT